MILCSVFIPLINNNILNMKKIISTSLVMFVAILIYGQDTNKKSNDYKFKFRSVEAGLGGYLAKFKKNRFISGDPNGSHTTEEFGDDIGASLNVSTSFLIKNNIMSLSLNIGMEATILWRSESNESNSFGAVSLLYGREWKMMRWFAIETHVGMGMYSSGDRVFDGRNVNLVRKEVLGVPVDFKFMFRKNTFDIGLNTGVNFNSINTTYYGNFILQYVFD